MLQEIESDLICTRWEVCLEGQRNQARENFVLIVRIHGFNILVRRSSHDLENFANLRLWVLAREKWTHFYEFCDDTASRPHINLGGIASRTEHKFRSTVVSRADVGDGRLGVIDSLCWSKVAQLKTEAIFLYKDVLGFDISVDDSLCMQVANRA